MSCKEASTDTFLPPYCGIFAFDNVIKTLEIMPNEEDVRKSVKFIKYTARIVASLAISYFCYSFIYYNAICFAIKSLSSSWSYFRKKEVFHYQHTDYNKDINKHIRFGLVDIFLFFSSYAMPIKMIIIVFYATFPNKFVEIANKAVYYKIKTPDDCLEGDT